MLKKIELTLWIILGIFAGCLLMCTLCGCSVFKGYKGDNPAEELIESVIETETGIAMDLSPSSPE